MPKVKLVSITKPLVEVDNKELTPEQYITYIARISNPKNQCNLETSDKLLKYCIKHNHWSIFEQVDMTVEIVTSRAIAAQLLRHKSAFFQEQSQRYAEVQSMEPIEFRLQDTKNRQNSLDVLANVDTQNRDNFKVYSEDESIANLMILVENHLLESQELYNNLLAKGVAKESARMILPLTATTKLYMKNNLRNWIHYIEVRALGEGVQKEHREIALLIQDIFKEHFSVISKALNW